MSVEKKFIFTRTSGRGALGFETYEKTESQLTPWQQNQLADELIEKFDNSPDCAQDALLKKLFQEESALILKHLKR